MRKLFLLLLRFVCSPARADEGLILELKIKDHKYTPEVLNVKAGERFKIRVTNEDPSSEEFESRSMIIEKFIGPKRSITVTLGPLKAGEYDFFGDFHPDTAKGKVVAK
jgi:plastocyanin